jgi:hypothetical protein
MAQARSVRVSRLGPRALRALAHEAAVTEDEPSPLAELRPSSPANSVVVLPSRATRVPKGAGKSGIQRTVTVTSWRSLDCAPVPDLGWEEADSPWHASGRGGRQQLMCRAAIKTTLHSAR